MANWAFTSYAIEGPKETLLKIEDAILHPTQPEGADEGWEGGILNTLGLTYEERGPGGTGKYMRGFIRDEVSWCDDDRVIRFDAKEAWGITDFYEVLEENFPDIKVYWTTEESGCEVYATNDKEGKYFSDRVCVDTCIDDNYQMDYFTSEKAAYAWLSKITDGKITNKEQAEAFNKEDHGDDFISVHLYEIV